MTIADRHTGGRSTSLPRASLALAVLVAFAAALLFARPELPLEGRRVAAALLTAARHGIEALCVAYALLFAWASVRFLVLRARPAALPPRSRHRRSPVGVVYLCCGDLDEEALLSLSRLEHEGPLVHLLHDDSSGPEERRKVEAAVERVHAATGVRWRVLRRPSPGGGKPGALRYLLERTAGEHEFFLIADNDSFAEDPRVLDRALDSFEDPRVAGVQLRNRARVGGRTRFERCLTSAIDVFDAFMTGLYQPLWVPFVGHNAVLRTAAVVQAGGFTPGMFADDIDLTVRLNLRGSRIVYRRELEMAERHPSNYRSFCLRSRKWARGCAQVLRSHLLAVLRSRRIAARAKAGFLVFSGVYLAQVALLAYAPIVFLLLPMATLEKWSPSAWSLVFGTVVPLSIFLPVLAYLLTEGRERFPVVRSLLATASTYGSTDAFTAAGLVEGWRRGERTWVPTNSVGGRADCKSDWLHFAAGALVLVLPLFLAPALLLFPLTWILAAKYLFVPAVAAYYGGGERSPVRGRPFPFVRRWATTALVLLALPFLLGGAAPPQGETVELREGRILVGGEPLLVRGIHYSPWRPGEGPGRGIPYPEAASLRSDLELVRGANANAILAYDPPRELLAIAGGMGLHVLYAFHVEWWRLAAGDGEEVARELGARVAELRSAPAVIGWMVGNEIPGWVIDEIGAEGVRADLARMRARIREEDPTRPVCHGNWPLHRTLELDGEMDLLAYNVYPFYPTEVAVKGFEVFLEQEILPLADGRPAIVTEFGVNTLEASPEEQAEILRSCWEDLLRAGFQGGFVFSFADEWWKNYDNPVAPPDWWRRRDAPDDHLSHDLDPEEHYGILTADREPKPAYSEVAEMFAAAAGEDSAWNASIARHAAWWAAASAVAAFILLPLALRFRGRRAAEPHSAGR